MLASKFDHGARLVSVPGMGGTAKTRLVTRFAWTVHGEYPGARGSAICRGRARPKGFTSRSRRSSMCRWARPIRSRSWRMQLRGGGGVW